MKKPKLSSLILKGCKDTAQCYSHCFEYFEGLSCCVIGAAYLGKFGKPDLSEGPYYWIKSEYPEIDHTALYRANDNLKMTREEIAQVLKDGGL